MSNYYKNKKEEKKIVCKLPPWKSKIDFSDLIFVPIPRPSSPPKF